MNDSNWPTRPELPAMMEVTPPGAMDCDNDQPVDFSFPAMIMVGFLVGFVVVDKLLNG